MGWYPDPAGSGDERYWDGSGWTHNLRSVSTASPATAPASVSAPTAMPQRPAGASAHFRVGDAPPWQRDTIVLASWGRRFLGLLLDLVMIYLLVNIAMTPFSPTTRSAGSYDELMSKLRSGTLTTPGQVWQVMSDYGYASWFVASLIALVVASVVLLALQYRFSGATLGQRAAGIRVIPAGHADQRRLGWGRSLVRALVLVLGLWIPFGFIVLALWPLLSRTRQGLHDRLAGTQVILR